MVPPRTILAVAAAWALLASVASADDKQSASAADASATFASLDANSDGQLTTDEVPADKRRLFERLVRVADKNGDGKLSGEEFVDGLKPRERVTLAPPPGPVGPRGEGRPEPAQLFRRLDANHDGKLTLDEVPEPRRERFKRLIERGDKDGDGALSQQEMAQAMRELDGGAGGPGNPEARAQLAQQMLRRLDKNGDGRITADEVPEERRQFIQRLMKRSDKNGDQALSLEEIKTGVRQPQAP